MITVHRKAMCLTMIKGIKFFPGMNTISDAEMARIEKHPGFVSELACGNMILGKHFDTGNSSATDESGDIKARAQKFVEEISAMKVSEAKEIIAEMGDGYLLRALKEKEGRKGIQDAVDTRLEEIKGQKGSDLAPESRVAPNGDGSDFVEKIGSSRADADGTSSHSAIPALNKNK